MGVREAFAVRESGVPDGPPILFAHGFGCDQGMWRHMAGAFEATHRVILFDHMGLGASDRSHYDAGRYTTIDGYATDVLTVCADLGLEQVVFVGHSVSSMIGVLAAGREPDRFSALVLLCPSPRYVDDPATGYRGGFTREDIDDLLSTLAHNYLGWAGSMAPVMVGRDAADPLSEELEATFCRADPEIARRFATATFLGDNRSDLARVAVRTLVVQVAHDVIAPRAVGRYVTEAIPDAEYVELDTTGHCPNLSDPLDTTAAIKAFL